LKHEAGDDLPLEVADLAHDDAHEAAEEELRGVIGESDDADFDGVVGEHVYGALGEEAGHTVEDHAGDENDYEEDCEVVDEAGDQM
jgi:hypothetical protein